MGAEVQLGVVGRFGADVVVADVAFALGLDLGVQGHADGRVAGLFGAGGHLQSQAAILEEILLEPERAGGGRGHVLQGTRGVGAEHHDRTHLAGGFDRGDFGLGMRRAVVAGGIEHDGQGDFLSQNRGGQRTVFDIHHHARAQHDRIEHGAGAADGDLIGGSAGDEIVVTLLDTLFGDLLVLENVDGFRGHGNYLEAGLETRWRAGRHYT